jgi:hypothetical protein
LRRYFSGEKTSGSAIITLQPEATLFNQIDSAEVVVIWLPRALQHVTHTYGDEANSRDTIVRLHIVDNYPLSYIAWAAMSQLDPVNHSNRSMQLSSQDIVYVYPMTVHNPPSVDTHPVFTSTVPSQTHVHVMVEFIKHKSPSNSV